LIVNDITDWLSAAALIALISNERFGARPSLLRHAASALYLDRRALRTEPHRRLCELALHGEIIESLDVWLRNHAGEMPGVHEL
jgi:hypothetical protein